MRQMLQAEHDRFGARSTAEAMTWVSVVTSVVGVMTVPALGGIWIDYLLGTKCLFLILGGIFGFVGAMYCLLNMANVKAGAHRSPEPENVAAEDIRGDLDESNAMISEGSPSRTRTSL